jgi:hypothetical protein
LGHAASRGAGQAGAKEGADVGTAAENCGVGEVRAGVSVHPHGGGDAARRGEVNGAPTAATMKGPRRLCRRGPNMGATAVVKGSRHGDGDGVPAAAACAPVPSLTVRRR